MDLMLFRHGIAEAYGPEGTDASRRLTEDGRTKTAQAGRGLARVAGELDAILTSPLVRARETAEILVQCFDCQLETLDVLGHGDAHAIVAAVARRREQRLVLVGHEPTLSQTAEFLCTGALHRFLVLKKAGCISLEARFDIATGGTGSARALLKWVAAPKMLRAMGARK